MRKTKELPCLALFAVKLSIHHTVFPDSPPSSSPVKRHKIHNNTELLNTYQDQLWVLLISAQSSTPQTEQFGPHYDYGNNGDNSNV